MRKYAQIMLAFELGPSTQKMHKLTKFVGMIFRRVTARKPIDQWHLTDLINMRKYELIMLTVTLGRIKDLLAIFLQWCLPIKLNKVNEITN